MSRLFPPQEITSSLTRVTDLIVNSSLYRSDSARVLLFGIGAGLALFQATYYTASIFAPLFRRGHNLSVRYGKNSWAVITGASDGIGKGYVHALAKKGFNIVLVGRNQTKLEQVAIEAKILVPEVQTRVVVADFVDSYQEGWAEKILEQVKDLDVSILVNNAGVGGINSYHKLSTKELSNMVLTNCLAHALITRVFIPKLALRYNRSAVINTCSLAGSSPRPFAALYSSTKVFHDYLSRGLAHEYTNVDFLSMKPGRIGTKMTNWAKPNLTTTTVEDHVKVALRDVGVVDHTFGHWKHRLDAWFVTNFGDFLGAPYFRRRYGMN